MAETTFFKEFQGERNATFIFFILKFFDKSSFHSHSGPQNSNFLTMNVSLSLMNTVAFVQNTFIGENSRKMLKISAY